MVIKIPYKIFSGGNPKDREWKQLKCQWSAKRQRFFEQKYPHCAKVDRTEDFEKGEFSQVVNEDNLDVIVDKTIEG